MSNQKYSQSPGILSLVVASSLMAVIAGCPVNVFVLDSCNDGEFCNGTETRVGGTCQPGTAVNCDDDVGCTDDSCNENTDSCDNIANDANCNDGIFCDGAEICDPVLDCQAGLPPSCDDDVECTDDFCNVQTDSCDNVGNDEIIAEENLVGEQDFEDGAVVSPDPEWLAAQSGEGLPFTAVWLSPTTLVWTHSNISTVSTATIMFSLWDLDAGEIGGNVSAFSLDGVPQPIDVFKTPTPNVTVRVYTFAVDPDLIEDGELIVSLTLPDLTGNAVGIDFSRLQISCPTPE